MLEQPRLSPPADGKGWQSIPVCSLQQAALTPVLCPLGLSCDWSQNSDTHSAPAHWKENPSLPPGARTHQSCLGAGVPVAALGLP